LKFLITGGCGFLGSNLSNQVFKLKEDLVIIDNLSRFGSELNLKWLNDIGKFKFYKVDTKDYRPLAEIIKTEKPDIIFHLAGQVAMTTSIENPIKDFNTNAKGTINILECVRRFSPESIILYSSTNKVYGELNYLTYVENKTRYVAKGFEKGFDESLRLEFSSPYGCSKGCADQYILDYNRIFGIRTIVFRHSSIFGGRQFATSDQGWIGWFCQKAYEIKNNINTKPFEIHGNGKQVRDILFAEDLIECYFKAAENINRVKGNVYNIGGGPVNSYSLLELFTELEEYLKIKMQYAALDFRKSDQKVFIADTGKAKNDFGFKVNIAKKDGLINMYNWIEKINKN
jgi:CDP-paratose 2-epimerase